VGAPEPTPQAGRAAAGGAAEARAASEVVLAARVLAAHGLDDPFAGHLTARVPGTGLFAFSPVGEPWSVVEDESVVIADADAVATHTAGPINYAAAANNLGLLENPGIDAVAHVHASSATLLGAVGRPLEPFCQEACLFFEDEAMIPDGFGFDPLRPEWLARSIGSRKVLIIRNHGLMAQGRSIAQAVAYAIQYERCAGDLLRLLSIGLPYSLIPADAARRFRDSNGSETATNAWYRSEIVSLIDG
jgi:ribulose-5-phosphate 4-epimerase/fuculose-1-phosphate aldolase